MIDRRAGLQQRSVLSIAIKKIVLIQKYNVFDNFTWRLHDAFSDSPRDRHANTH